MAGIRIRLNVEEDEEARNAAVGRLDGLRSTPPPCVATTRDESHPEVGKMVLSGEELKRVTASLKPILSGMRNAVLTFCAEGAIVQGSVHGQRLFVPIVASDFTSYCWRGEPAVFLSSTDSKRTLLDAFRSDKKRVPAEVTFVVSGTAPGRSIAQTVAFTGGDAIAHSTTTSTMKYELWSSSTMYPSVDPDVSFCLTKQQLGKVAAVAGKVQNEAMTFALKPEGGFYIGTAYEVIRLDVDGSNMKDYPYSSASSSSSSMLRYLTATKSSKPSSFLANESSPSSPCNEDHLGTKSPTKRSSANSSQVAGNKTKTTQRAAVGFGSGKPFCLALEDTSSFRAMLQKIRTGSDGVTLSFYTSTPVPMIRVLLHTPVSPSVFMFCTTDCAPIHELEAVSAVSGSLGQRPPSSVPLKKRAYPASGSNKCVSNGEPTDANQTISSNSAPPEKKPKRSTAGKKGPAKSASASASALSSSCSASSSSSSFSSSSTSSPKQRSLPASWSDGGAGPKCGQTPVPTACS